MISLLDIAERIQKGPRMEVKDWDMGLYKKMEELSKKYGLKYPEDGSYFNVDNDIVERAFQAAIDFLVEMGIYCLSTQRVVKFEREEIFAAIKDAPNKVIVGEGKDTRIISQKKVEGKELLNQCPGHHAPFTEEFAPLIVKNFAQVRSGDYLEGFNFQTVDGREIFEAPMEVYAAKREVAWMREGIRKAGRPGMAIAYYPINTRAATLVAPIDPNFGLRKTDGVLLSILPDVKIEKDLLTAAIVYEDYGCFKVNGGGAGAVGGFCGGVEGAIIAGIVKTIGGWICYRDVLTNTGVWDIRVGTAKNTGVSPQKVWGCSVVLQTLNRKTNFICFGDTATPSGPGTEAHLIELGIIAIYSAINGANLYIPRKFRARMNAGQTPLEAEFMSEVADATVRAGINREEGNEIVKRLAKKLENREVENGPDDIRDCYDLVYHKPKNDYEQIYLKVKKEFRDAGVPVR